MLGMYINTYSKTQMREYFQEISTADLNMVIMPDVTYVVVENEKHEKLFIFGILGKVKIHEHIPSMIDSQITLNGKTWVVVLSHVNEAGIYIEIPAHIFMMLDIIKRYEAKGINAIREELEKYCKKNGVQNYSRDYIVN